MGRKNTCRRNKTRRGRRGGRGGLGMSSYGVGDRSTTGASSVLAQYTGTPGVSRGGARLHRTSKKKKERVLHKKRL